MSHDWSYDGVAHDLAGSVRNRSASSHADAPMHLALAMYIRGYILLDMASKKTTVFVNGNSVAVRLLGPCRLPPGTAVREYRDGNRVVIEPVAEWPRSFVEALGQWDEEIPRSIDDGPQRDPFQ